MNRFQHTIKRTVRFGGVGLHSGEAVKMVVRPAEENFGVQFVRSDIGENAVVPAFMDCVVDTALATTIAAGEVRVSTTEHVLSALAGLGIDNVLIEVDGPEVPILDGSAGPFVHVLKKAGREKRKARKQFLKINREITYNDGGKEIKVLPYDGLKVTCEIDFDHPLIQQQSYSLELSPEQFVREISPARTFGFLDEVQKLQENGLALGGSLDNAIVVDKFGILNSDGLRFRDEFARHKVLDLVGDLALLGYPLMGHVVASRSGHGQHLGLLRAIAENPECWEMVKFEKGEDNGVLERVVTSTKAVGNHVLPLLMPPGSFQSCICAA